MCSFFDSSFQQTAGNEDNYANDVDLEDYDNVDESESDDDGTGESKPKMYEKAVCFPLISFSFPFFLHFSFDSFSPFLFSTPILFLILYFILCFL